jgi:AcrR family transcriptional regulator
MACFREHGYARTSIRDLEAATGLRAPSLYQAFGNKAALFAAALARYQNDVLARRIAEHLQPSLGIDGIRSFFVSTYTTEPQPRHGCMLVNSAVEFASLDRRARRVVDGGLAQIHAAFSACLALGQRTGGVHASVEPDRAAQVLVMLYQGLLVLLRTRQRVVDFDLAIDNALQSIATGVRA